MNLTQPQVDTFEATGVVHLPNWMARAHADELSREVDALTVAPDRPGYIWKFYDETAQARGEHILSRMERLVPHHAALRALLVEGAVAQLATKLLGERAILFKDKVNLKLPGSDGFLAHQDAQAGWRAYGPNHLTIMISLDATTRENGCLEVERGRRRRELCGAEWRPLASDEVAQNCFEFLETSPGDVVAFDSYLVHRSAPNRTAYPRRVIYATYNPASQGDCYERYFADKHKNYPPDVERDAGKQYRYRV